MITSTCTSSPSILIVLRNIRGVVKQVSGVRVVNVHLVIELMGFAASSGLCRVLIFRRRRKVNDGEESERRCS